MTPNEITVETKLAVLCRGLVAFVFIMAFVVPGPVLLGIILAGLMLVAISLIAVAEREFEADYEDWMGSWVGPHPGGEPNRW